MNTGFAITLLVLVGILPFTGLANAAVYNNQSVKDKNDNGLEDILDDWLTGTKTWQQLRDVAEGAGAVAKSADNSNKAFPSGIKPQSSTWQSGQLRLIGLHINSYEMSTAVDKAARDGACRILHSSDQFGGFCVLAADQNALKTILAERPTGKFILDRDGTPALDNSRVLSGVEHSATGQWELGNDWFGSIAIIDSGCDSAHGDLGDQNSDNADGPPPFVGDEADWYDASTVWPVFLGYKIIGWHDVTDDFPEAVGPWDYHHHGTALASVAAGRGIHDWRYKGVAPAARLTIVKFYDFDETWHAWAGDFLAACAWTLEHAEDYRIRTVLMTVNWEVDAGISAAVDAFLAAGIVPVAAMGNFGSELASPGYPAAANGALTVGSVNDAGAIAAYSGRGLEGTNKPDLVAPGGGLLAENGRITAADSEPNDTYSGRRGTSLAAAHVAGAVYSLSEALRQNGITLSQDIDDARMLKNVIKASAAYVGTQETEDGENIVLLPATEKPDGNRGWGLLRLDAASESMLIPLLPGDNITIESDQPSIARRLITSPGIRYLIEAVPAAGLDVSLEIMDPLWIDDPILQNQIIRANDNGAGSSEIAYTYGGLDGWSLIVVKKISGTGSVTLRLREADNFPYQAAVVELPGHATGSANSGNIDGSGQLSVVVPSRVRIDQVARSLNVFDPEGVTLPGWPVFLFPHPSSSGGLTQPLVWDLDQAGVDEIVVASDYGSIYFFDFQGHHQDFHFQFNRKLSAPVGVITAAEERHVVSIDDIGIFRSWSAGAVLEHEVDFATQKPLLPAVGELLAAAGEEIVLCFIDGTVMVVNSAGEIQPGWPVNAGGKLTIDPILVDLDGDLLHEIVVPVHGTNGSLVLRVLNGQGQAGPGDNESVEPPGGGSWLKLSPAAVVGNVYNGNIKVVLAGLCDNDLTGVDAVWSSSEINLGTDGMLSTTVLPGFELQAVAQASALTLEHQILSAPVSWYPTEGAVTEPVWLIHSKWREFLYGLTTIPGGMTSLIGRTPDASHLAARMPLTYGGKNDTILAAAGLTLLPLEEGQLGLVEIRDDQLRIVPVLAGSQMLGQWLASRCDSRNTGAMPLRPPQVAGISPIVTKLNLSAYPNPGTDHFSFCMNTSANEKNLEIDIFDLRGRRIKQLNIEADAKNAAWDGTDSRGKPVATGTYFAKIRAGQRQAVTRVTVTR